MSFSFILLAAISEPFDTLEGMSLPLDTSTLRTGKDLDTTSIQLVQSAILEETQALLDIEAKLQGLVKEIQSLDTERTTLQEKLQFHQALVAPVSGLSAGGRLNEVDTEIGIGTDSFKVEVV